MRSKARADVQIVKDLNVETRLAIAGTDVTATAAELNILDGVTSSTAELNLLTGVTASTAELNIIDGVTATASEINKVDGVTGYLVEAAEVTFTETTGAGTYTGSITVPAGATILDIKVRSTALWDTQTSATMKVGDVADDDGWFIGVDLIANDLLVGEELNFVQTGGVEGAYLSTTTGKRSTAYSASARVISGVITTVGATGSAGRTRMMVVYALPTATAATKA